MADCFDNAHAPVTLNVPVASHRAHPLPHRQRVGRLESAFTPPPPQGAGGQAACRFCSESKKARSSRQFVATCGPLSAAVNRRKHQLRNVVRRVRHLASPTRETGGP